MRRGFSHPLGDHPLPRQLTEEELSFCYKMLRHSVHHWKTAAQVMLESHLKLGMSTVTFFVPCDPKKSDVLVSEMLFSLWTGIIRLHEGAIDHHGETPNPVGYLMVKLKGDLRNLLNRDGLVRVNIATYRKILKKGEPRRVLFLDLTNEAKKRAITTVDVAEKDLETIVFNRCCESERDRQIINFRLDGLRDEEIGQKLNPPLTKGRIQQIRTKIADKLKRILDHE